MPAPEEIAEPGPTADVWVDEKYIAMVIRNPFIIEYGDALAPGLRLSSASAILLAGNLLAAAGKVMEEEDPK